MNNKKRAIIPLYFCPIWLLENISYFEIDFEDVQAYTPNRWICEEMSPNDGRGKNLGNNSIQFAGLPNTRQLHQCD